MEKLRLLVIDDEPGIRSGVERILRNYSVSYPFMDNDFSFEVYEAATGEEGIEIINNSKPHIVLLDNKLPGIQGTEVLEYIRERNIETTVAMITSYASLEVAVKATGDGAYDFIPKPFTPQELKASIDHIAKQLFLRQITLNLKKEGKQIRYQFLSVLSHELNSPLNAIEGYLRLMQQKDAGENIDEYQIMIEQSLNRIQGMRNLIMDMLDFTKIRFEKKEEKIKEFDVIELMKMAISTIRPYAIQKNININFIADKDIVYNADPDDIEIIMNNLLSNSVKYNQDNGRVDVKIEETQSNIIISVTDTGIGITNSEKEKLFNEFYRVKNEKTKHISGSGLGLSIVKKITDIYKGTIDIVSVPEKGSEFIVTLPK